MPKARPSNKPEPSLRAPSRWPPRARWRAGDQRVSHGQHAGALTQRHARRDRDHRRADRGNRPDHTHLPAGEPPVQRQRRRHRPHRRRPHRGLVQRLKHRQTEPLRIPLAAPGRHPRRALGQARPADPGPQQHRLCRCPAAPTPRSPGPAPAAARTAGDGDTTPPAPAPAAPPAAAPAPVTGPMVPIVAPRPPTWPVCHEPIQVTCAVPQTPRAGPTCCPVLRPRA